MMIRVWWYVQVDFLEARDAWLADAGSRTGHGDLQHALSAVHSTNTYQVRWRCVWGGVLILVLMFVRILTLILDPILVPLRIPIRIRIRIRIRIPLLFLIRIRISTLGPFLPSIFSLTLIIVRNT